MGRKSIVINLSANEREFLEAQTRARTIQAQTASRARILLLKAEGRPINEIASSHMARRTFVGGLFKKVKDPNLIGALSGHKAGSKAFARYRDIDDDIRRDVMGNLDI